MCWPPAHLNGQTTPASQPSSALLVNLPTLATSSYIHMFTPFTDYHVSREDHRTEPQGVHLHPYWLRGLRVHVTNCQLYNSLMQQIMIFIPVIHFGFLVITPCTLSLAFNSRQLVSESINKIWDSYYSVTCERSGHLVNFIFLTACSDIWFHVYNPSGRGVDGYI